MKAESVLQRSTRPRRRVQRRRLDFQAMGRKRSWPYSELSALPSFRMLAIPIANRQSSIEMRQSAIANRQSQIGIVSFRNPNSAIRNGVRQSSRSRSPHASRFTFSGVIPHSAMSLSLLPCSRVQRCPPAPFPLPSAFCLLPSAY